RPFTPRLRVSDPRLSYYRRHVSADASSCSADGSWRSVGSKFVGSGGPFCGGSPALVVLVLWLSLCEPGYSSLRGDAAAIQPQPLVFCSTKRGHSAPVVGDGPSPGCHRAESQRGDLPYEMARQRIGSKQRRR